MAISGFLFLSWRLAELITLIPIIGMLAWFVHGFIASNQLTPTYILVLFITSVLAAAWVLFTVLDYLRARHSAVFVALADLAFVGAFVAGVVELRAIAAQNCADFTSPNPGSLYYSLGPFGQWGHDSGNSNASDLSKNCAVLKACFAFGIMECVFFSWTFLLALLVARHHRNDDKERVVVRRETRSSRRRSSRRPSSRGSYDNRASSRHRSDRSRRNYQV